MSGTAPISVTIRDRERLLQVADSFVGRRQEVLVRFLLHEVARAAIVASDRLSRRTAWSVNFCSASCTAPGEASGCMRISRFPGQPC